MSCSNWNWNICSCIDGCAFLDMVAADQEDPEVWENDGPPCWAPSTPPGARCGLDLDH